MRAAVVANIVVEMSVTVDRQLKHSQMRTESAGGIKVYWRRREESRGGLIFDFQSQLKLRSNN